MLIRSNSDSEFFREKTLINNFFGNTKKLEGTTTKLKRISFGSPLKNDSYKPSFTISKSLDIAYSERQEKEYLLENMKQYTKTFFNIHRTTEIMFRNNIPQIKQHVPIF